MKTFLLHPSRFLLLRWAWLLLLMLLCQIVFACSYRDLSSCHSLGEFFVLWGSVLRFALSSSAWILLPFILLCLLPLPFRSAKFYRYILDFFYYLCSILLLMPSCIDNVYYHFSKKRMSADVFQFLGGGDDFSKLVPRFLADFWPHFLFFFVLLFLVYVGARTLVIQKTSYRFPRTYLQESLYLLLLAPLVVVAQRGGIQYRPLEVFHASAISPTQCDLILNTPFTIMKTIGKKTIVIPEYFDDPASLKAHFQAEKNFVPRSDQRPNLIVLVMESFSSEYMGCYNGGGKTYTPFLDSLSAEAHLYSGYANTFSSMRGIPAVLAGLPNLLGGETYIVSQYAKNKLESIASLLSEKGYTSAFFHGGYNGTLGLNSFCRSIGYQAYFGKDEYPNPHHDDKHWGISDHYFLPWTLDEIRKLTPPFHAAIYSLSSHHPYIIPKEVEASFEKGSLEIHQSIRYADYALAEFFRQAEKESWFSNTLFIITSDHGAQSDHPDYQTPLKRNTIPMIWYYPGKIKAGQSAQLFQQIDLLPSLMEYLGSPRPFISFGESIFSADSTRYLLQGENEYYQLYSEKGLINFDGKEYSYTSFQKGTDSEASQLLRLKAVIQDYNRRILHNEMSLYFKTTNKN